MGPSCRYILVYIYIYLEPKWPLFWMEKTLFWRVQTQKHRTNRFQVYIYRWLFSEIGDYPTLTLSHATPRLCLHHRWVCCRWGLSAVGMVEFFFPQNGFGHGTFQYQKIEKMYQAKCKWCKFVPPEGSITHSLKKHVFQKTCLSSIIQG